MEAPATELLLKTMAPSVAMKFWVTPELFGNASATKSEGKSPGQSGRKGARPDIENDPVHFRVGRKREVRLIGNIEGCRISRPIRNRGRRPVRGGIPVTAYGVELPGRAAGECGLKNEE